jgi:S-adenosylmethionine:tRNA ribosyltransferase-isomerase
VRTDELDYTLPEELVASRPLPERAASRLLVALESLAHETVRELPHRIAPGTVIVVNDTRVLKARLFGHKLGTSGRVEFLFVRMLDAERWQAMARSSKPLRVGAVVAIEGAASRALVHVESERDREGLLTVRVEADEPIESLLERVGHIPLPPYMGRDDEDADGERYQTVFARVPGAVAAPTAGLHFDEALLSALRERGAEVASVTLHVGPGTFRPVAVDELDLHPMHSEAYEVPEATARAIARARERGAPVLAIGTTVVRTLESAYLEGSRGLVEPKRAETRLLIQPGHAFRVVDALVTNFHLPRSTLLALVFAFGGVERVRAAYAAAIEARYRFYSYGDAMYLPSCISRGPR